MAKKTVVFDPIKNYVRKNLMKVSDEGIMVIPNSQKVDFQSAILKELLIKNGIDPSAIKSENAMNEAMAFINQRTKQETGIMAASQGNVIDIRDKMPNPFENLDKAVKEGNFMGIKNQLLKDPDIKKDFEAMKKFPTRVASGEDAIPIARRAKFDEEVPYKPLSDEDYTVGKLVSDFKQYGKATDEDIQMILGSGKAGQIPYVMSERGMSYKDVISTLKSGKPLIEGLAQGGRIGYANGTPSFEDYLKERKGIEQKRNFEQLYKEYLEDLRKKEVAEQKQMAAQGGRIGYKDGPEKPGRRKFLKIAGGLAALPIIGKFFKPAKVGTVAKTAPKIVTTAPEAPSYFFDLVNKIKISGKQRQTPSYKERVNEYTYTGKNGIEYELVEDLDTGEIRIIKDKLGGRNYGDESYETIEDRTEMVFRKGQADETTKGKKPPDEYEEYKVEFDQDGTAADATDIDEISKKEIIEEVSGETPSIKKAGGGIARMLGE